MVTFVRIHFSQKTSEIKKVSISGHANFSSKGKDIVCSAISAIVNGSINFYFEKFPKFLKVKIDESKIEINILEKDEKFQDSLQMMIFQLKNISKNYPSYLIFKKSRFR